MRYSCLSSFLLLVAAFFFCCQNLTAQTLNYQPPADFFVCGSGIFEITVNNTSGDALTGVTVTIDFNTNSGAECGTAYLPGTVLNAGEANISDLSAPVFSLPNVAAGQQATFTFEATAPCSVVGCIDGAEIFVNEILLAYDGGGLTITTAPYDIERALLVITSINSTLMTGSKGDALLRKIKIVNSRPGALQNFLFTDQHQGGISITSNVGTDISPGGNTFQLVLDGSDFALIGDGDGLFELNEVIEITEEILITDCGVDIHSTVSTFTAAWGCAGSICQQVTANAIVVIEPADRVPDLVFQPISNMSECFCGPNGYEQGIKITNNGTGPALDLAFRAFRQMPAIDYLIDTASVWVDSAGLTLDIQPVVNATATLPAPCQGPTTGLSGSFVVTIPQLAPGESVTVFFDTYFCETNCPLPIIDWWYTYSYFKECPPNPFFQLDDPVQVFDIGKPMQVGFSTSPATPMQDDSTYTVQYSLEYDSLSVLNDTLQFDLKIPCGMNWLGTNQLIIDGQMPLNYTVEVVGDFTCISASYVLPFSADSVGTSFSFVFDCEDICFENQFCLDSIETSCMALDTCSVPPGQVLGLEVTTTLRKCPEFPLGCNLQSCNSIGLFHECPLDSVCISAPPGYVNFEFAATRKNYGLADDNNDRLPDGTGGANLNLVQRHRAIAGDTIRAELRGEVVMDIPGATLPNAVVAFQFTAQKLLAPNLLALMKDQTGIRQAGMLVRIFDSSSGNWYECNGPVPAVSPGGALLYTYDLSASTLGGCLPSGFEFAAGDSILVTADYRIQHNLTPDLDAEPLYAWLFIRPSAFTVYEPGAEDYKPLTCGCTSQRFELSGYERAILPGVFGLPPCGPSSFVGGNLFRLSLHQDNFFPFEYRNLLTMEDWQILLPTGVGLLQSQLTFWNYQGGGSLFNSVPLTPIGMNPYHFNVQQFQNPPIDEGFSVLFQYKFQAACNLAGSLPLRVTALLDFDDGLPQNPDPLTFTVQSNALRPLVPNLSATAFNCDLISFNDQLVFDFSFANFPTMVASQTSGPAQNTWMYVTSPSGLVSNFQLIDVATGTPFPKVNGVFQLGNFPIDTVQLRLLGTNLSCQTEPLTLHYGWNCGPFTSQVQTACYRQQKPLTIFSPPGEIDFLVENPLACSDLCDTVPYHTLEIFNGQLGAVYELTASAQMPPGLTVIPGSSEVEYPTGSGLWQPIGDPTAITGSLVQWNLTELVASLANGLPGVGAALQNSLRLRFLSGTDCDLVANGFILFTIAAEQNCGTASNTVSKASDPICILGLDPTYSTQVVMEVEPGFGCNDEALIQLSLTSSAEMPLGACVIVNLPVGISFENGSCNSVCQANFNCTPTVNGTTLTWQLPPGVPPNQIVCFQFNTTGWASLDCVQGFIQVSTAAETEALCALTGDSCSAKVQTGSLLFPYNIQRPEFLLENFIVNATQSGPNDIINFSVKVVNEGAVNEPPIIVQFYLDTDGNGTGDVLVHTQNLVAALANGQSQTMTGNFSIPSGNICNLVASIDPAAQCACSGDVATVLVPITYQTEQDLTVCSNQEVPIGVAEMPGFTYQWTPTDCLTDQQAATTIFSCANNGTQPLTYQFSLAETDGSCDILNLLSVTVQPVPGIAFADSPICQGMTANIAATDGDSYQWSGPGTVQGQQFQTVMPSSTSTYAVTVTDALGCSGAESVVVVVNPLPMANAGPDINVCPGQTAQLSATAVPGATYLWSPAIVGSAPALGNPTVPNPTVLTTQPTTFTLTVTSAAGCVATDQASVDFAGTLVLSMPPDVTICLGSGTALTSSGADSYVWSPDGTCLDPPACASIEVFPTETTTYLVEASSVDGCTASGSVTVTVTQDTISIVLDPLQICEGETVFIFGEEVGEAGTYCDTIPALPGECDTVICQTLLVNPAIDTVLTLASVCEGGSVFFENMTVSEPGLTCVSYPTPTGCDSTLCLDLTVIPLPEITLTILPDTVVEAGTEITLSIEPSAFDSIVWMGGSILDECTNLPTCTDILGEESVTYTVTVSNADGCEGMAQQLVTVGIECEPSKAEIPNVFTPNGDGVNDVWTIVSPGAETVLNMRIWNRWGEKVYDGPGPWDGMQDSIHALSDVYVYLIRVGCPVQIEGAEEEVLKGDVTLLR